MSWDMIDLEVYIRARYPLLYLLTPEEERAVATVKALGAKLGKPVVLWSFTEGLGGDPGLSDPIAALEAIRCSEERALYVLRDMHPFFGNPAVVRKLRELASALKQSAKGVLLLSPVLKLPPELTKEVTVIDFPVPDGETVAGMIEQAGKMAKLPVALDRLQTEQLVAAAKGLTAGEIANALAKTMVLHRQLDDRAIDVMVAEKHQIVRKTGVLEYVDQPEAIAHVGGLDRLKGWLGKRGGAFGSRARDFGLPEPRGLLLVGVQGCGKSLVAKCVASQWHLPLLRLDVGRLMSSLVGESEENVRRTLAMAEALSPVVLWVDEIEKGFAGLGSHGDSGTTSRVFATFLTWLQEKQAPVFVVATANDLGALPPELLRKGRFDEIFFVDLPDAAERRAILEIHLRKRQRHLADFDLESLAEACEGFSGAEIEQGLIAALYDAFEENRPLTTEDLLKAFAVTVPLSRTASGAIERLRAWARENARGASGGAPSAPARLAGRIEVDLPSGT
ncbi:MAG: AAA family ATPase [Candidatus Sericytochromatia bacterium]